MHLGFVDPRPAGFLSQREEWPADARTDGQAFPRRLLFFCFLVFPNLFNPSLSLLASSLGG